jgi:hypothetical protein
VSRRLLNDSWTAGSVGAAATLGDGDAAPGAGAGATLGDPRPAGGWAGIVGGA